jgi:thioredoxin 1
MDSLRDVGDDTFEAEVLESAVPVVVDFWAAWCPPCRALTPILEELARQNAGKVKIVKMDVDDHKKTAADFSVRSIPTLLVFKGGRMVHALTGGMATKRGIETSVAAALAG